MTQRYTIAILIYSELESTITLLVCLAEWSNKGKVSPFATLSYRFWCFQKFHIFSLLTQFVSFLIWIQRWIHDELTLTCEDLLTEQSNQFCRVFTAWVFYKVYNHWSLSSTFPHLLPPPFPVLLKNLFFLKQMNKIYFSLNKCLVNSGPVHGLVMASNNGET